MYAPGDKSQGAFAPGDYIKQAHQVGGRPRLVVVADASHLLATSNPDVVVVVVFDDDSHAFRKVFTWGHTLVQAADDASRERAADMVLSEAYAATTSREQW